MLDAAQDWVRVHSARVWLACVITGGICVTLACILSAISIWRHLRNYTSPVIQKYAIRIIVMIPVYAIDSYMGLVWKAWAFYWDVIRDTYEAYVLYCFFVLMIELGGGEEAMIEQLEEKPQIKFLMPFCCFHIKPGRTFLHRCKQLILQYVYIKLVLTVVTFVTQLFGVYQEGNWSPKYAYLYVTIAYNVSITISLYFLVQFYEATKDILKLYKPLAKFLCIKTIVFFTFWQGILISGFSSIGLIEEHHDWSVEDISYFIESYLICVEMLPLAIVHMFTFGTSSFGDLIPRGDTKAGLVDSLNFRDVMHDTRAAVKKNPKRNIDVGSFTSASKTEQMERVVKQAWLKKRGEDIVKKWKERYFLLISQPAGLVFYKSNPFLNADELRPRGFIPLSLVTEVVTTEKREDKEFVLVTPARRWHILAESTMDRTEWLSAIRSMQLDIVVDGQSNLPT
ncbi:hypothetical protein PROFUN_09439 [Planoprotostelium fungivorum]|uniref:PH domain-containing protein n=1 Tax=Planoprotostelium fungivorum TaxID=1890364 RepID=A0A2P6NH03_9EUKA|nr:hypothetical protein PROFUN_09439 [Planoprotostelium fungivorum]